MRLGTGLGLNGRRSASGSAATPTGARRTEDGTVRKTEDGTIRTTEGA